MWSLHDSFLLYCLWWSLCIGSPLNDDSVFNDTVLEKRAPPDMYSKRLRAWGNIAPRDMFYVSTQWEGTQRASLIARYFNYRKPREASRSSLSLVIAGGKGIYGEQWDDVRKSTSDPGLWINLVLDQRTQKTSIGVFEIDWIPAETIAQRLPPPPPGTFRTVERVGQVTKTNHEIFSPGVYGLLDYAIGRLDCMQDDGTLEYSTGQSGHLGDDPYPGLSLRHGFKFSRSWDSNNIFYHIKSTIDSTALTREQIFEFACMEWGDRFEIPLTRIIDSYVFSTVADRRRRRVPLLTLPGQMEAVEDSVFADPLDSSLPIRLP
ncbi:MAG: hypothetical protein M1833_001845 [Piccolia ochrophora]|nr:MAG: hypothetical protein M1833_001845 [Piccolia ochrophora]